LATHPKEETLRDYAICWLPIPTSAQRVTQVEAAALYPSAVAVPLNPPTCPGTMLSVEIPAIKNMDSMQHSLSNIVCNHRAFRCHQQIFVKTNHGFAERNTYETMAFAWCKSSMVCNHGNMANLQEDSQLPKNNPRP